MVEKFNFYDIYGYLLPGIVLVSLLWLPFGLFFHVWPKDLSAAVIVVVLSYIIGHIVQSFSIRLIPSSTKRHPSDLVLDADSTFTPETKKRIDQLCRVYFDLMVEPQLEPKADPATKPEERKAITLRRKDAFFQARSVLLKDKKTSYWEQFEGLYALMRNITAVGAVAASYFLGWGVAFSHKVGILSGFSQRDGWASWSLVLILFFAVKVVQFSLPAKPSSEENSAHEENDRKQDEKNTTIAFRLSLLCVAFLAGMLLCLGGKAPQLPMEGPFVMLGMALAAVVVSARCYSAYNNFAWSFAEHVWRDFASLEKPSQTPDSLQL